MNSAYENLPVYKKALDLTVYIENIVRNFSRYNKYTVGTELRNLSRHILVLIAKANIKVTRKEYLIEVLEKLEEFKILIRICKEIKAFHFLNSYEVSSKLAIEIIKQCEGWLRSQNPAPNKLGAGERK